MIKKILALLLLSCCKASAQGSGTPNNLRVLTDANNYLLVSASAQTLPLSNPQVFSNTRLKTDANGYLQVVLTGGVNPTFPLAAPVGCTTISYSFVGRTTTGLCSSATNTWNLYAGGVNSILGTDSMINNLLPTLVGAAGTPVSNFEVTDTINTVPRGIVNSQYSSDTSSARFNCYKARGTRASPTVIVTGDILCNFSAYGYDGSNFLNSAAIQINSTGTIASTRIPTQINFFTATDAAPSVLTNALTINEVQNVGIGSTATSSTITRRLNLASSAGSTLIRFTDTSQSAGSRNWILGQSGSSFIGAVRNDSDNAGVSWLTVNQSSTAPTTITFTGTSVVTTTFNATTAYQANGTPGATHAACSVAVTAITVVEGLITAITCT